MIRVYRSLGVIVRVVILGMMGVGRGRVFGSGLGFYGGRDLR